MRKSLVGLFLLLSVAVTAGQRTPEQAAEIAAQFTNQQPQLRNMHAAPRKASTMRLAHKAMQNNSEDAAFYVFNQEGNNGFVIVSADDRTAEDILVYSEQGAFDVEKINPSFRWWLSRFTDEISALQNDSTDEGIAPRKASEAAEAIEPLLKNAEGKEITWYQEEPYNRLCPIDLLDNTRSLTGCVATAAAMVMYKWRWPIQGTGSSQYTWENCTKYSSMSGSCTKSTPTVLSANYGQTAYDWDNMLSTYANSRYYNDVQANAVATLMYHCGVAAEMGYGGQEANGSGALTDYMAYGLQTYFSYKYEKFVSMYSKRTYGGAHSGVTAEWNVTTAKLTEYFNADLEAGRPIIMGGEDRSGGHEFVCDGRDGNGRFHINWGWEGDNNCYTTLSSMKPDGTSYKFNSGLDAIIGLEPNIPEAIVNTEVKQAAKKILRDGQVIIVREDGEYSVFGQKIK